MLHLKLYHRNFTIRAQAFVNQVNGNRELLANAAGVHLNTLARVINYSSNTTLDTLFAVEVALDPLTVDPVVNSRA